MYCNSTEKAAINNFMMNMTQAINIIEGIMNNLTAMEKNETEMWMNENPMNVTALAAFFEMKYNVMRTYTINISFTIQLFSRTCRPLTKRY